MKKKLFPLEFVHSTVTHYTFIVSKYSISVYSLVTLSILGLLAALPFIQVEINQRSIGVLAGEHNDISVFSPVSARLESFEIKENQLVSAGDTVLVMSHVYLSRKREQAHQERNRFTQHIDDYSYLLSTPDPTKLHANSIVSPEVRRVFLMFMEGAQLVKKEVRNANHNYKRQKQLFEEKVIAEKEFEKDKLILDKALSEREIVRTQHQNEWQNQRLQLERELSTILTDIERLAQEISQYYIICGTDGNVKNLTVLGQHQHIQSGQKLLDITPATELYASCYVTPKDIGLLKEGQEVKFSIDAYDFNDWGFITGKVVEISASAYSINSKAAFLVKCSLDKDEISLPNGFTTELKKGMTLTANFFVAKRTILQLIFDRVDDWYNPNRL
ncbi:MAG: multidrug resistance efflux pump [Cyclobacteriaceae bacterium]|jgi:multidrug resistance efflux pump